MKIALICSFSNSRIQKVIKPLKRGNERGQWISYYIEEFKKYPEHEFYIISPHRWLMKDKYYSEKNIHYYFFRWGIPLIGRPWPGIFNLDFITNYWLNKLKIRRYIKKINPDIINLFGAENSYYSSAILQFVGKYPILLSIQGFINRRLDKYPISKSQVYQLNMEKEILKSINDQNIRTDDMFNYAIKQNPNLKEYRFDFPCPYGRLAIPDRIKKYDFVFFAQATKDKGIYDFLLAVNYIKQVEKDVKAVILGPCNKAMQRFIREYCLENNLSNNINHIGFLDTQEKLFKKVKEAKISVLPTYNDIISGTIIESMFLKIPVITYKTGSIPDVNKDRENIIICEQGNNEELQQEMLKLLYDKTKQKRLADNGYEWVLSMCDSNKAMEGYFDALKQIIKSFRK